MITINVYEKNNHLYADDQTKPIVCGNTNYQIEFDFQGDFANVGSKIAVLVIGDKKLAIDFAGTTLDLPALPNGNELKLVVMSAESEDLELVSSVLTLALKPTLEADNLNEFEPISNYVSAVITRINGLLDGNLSIYSAKIAENVSNPNLLINGDFKVNQRGGTTYSTAGAYTVDRWKLVSGSLTVEDAGITLNGAITQTLENPPTMDVVASVDTSDGDVTATYSNGVFTISTTTETLITWAKLEVGTTATIFSPRPYAEELNLCQRYYLKLKKELSSSNYHWFGNVYCFSSSVYYLTFSIGKMRICPSISFYGTLAIVEDGIAKELSNENLESLQVYSYDGNTISYRDMSSVTGLTSNTWGFLRSNNDADAYVSFDAEIY